MKVEPADDQRLERPQSRIFVIQESTGTPLKETSDSVPALESSFSIGNGLSLEPMVKHLLFHYSFRPRKCFLVKRSLDS